MKLALSERTQLCFGPLLLDLAGRRALMHEEELNLSPVEFDLTQICLKMSDCCSRILDCILRR